MASTQGAAAKGAGTRQSPETRGNLNRTPRPLTDERREDWDPARISDRKLMQLAVRLERVRRLGDAFADIDLSLQARRRLERLMPAGLREEPEPTS